MSEALKTKLLERIVEVDGPLDTPCWIWTGASSSNGYGQIAWNGQVLSTHRLSYELHCGPIPHGLCVLHKCDVPSCCCPDHLFVGTDRDNWLDAIEKGRTRHRGAEHGGARLTEDGVIEIRRLVAEGHQTHHEIAEQFGVSRSTVSQIKRGASWAWLNLPSEEIGTSQRTE
jgi:hypothetical protein